MSETSAPPAPPPLPRLVLRGGNPTQMSLALERWADEMTRVLQAELGSLAAGVAREAARLDEIEARVAALEAL